MISLLIYGIGNMILSTVNGDNMTCKTIKIPVVFLKDRDVPPYSRRGRQLALTLDPNIMENKSSIFTDVIINDSLPIPHGWYLLRQAKHMIVADYAMWQDGSTLIYDAVTDDQMLLQNMYYVQPDSFAYVGGAMLQITRDFHPSRRKTACSNEPFYLRLQRYNRSDNTFRDIQSNVTTAFCWSYLRAMFVYDGKQCLALGYRNTTTVICYNEFEKKWENSIDLANNFNKFENMHTRFRTEFLVNQDHLIGCNGYVYRGRVPPRFMPEGAVHCEVRHLTKGTVNKIELLKTQATEFSTFKSLLMYSTNNRLYAIGITTTFTSKYGRNSTSLFHWHDILSNSSVTYHIPYKERFYISGIIVPCLDDISSTPSGEIQDHDESPTTVATHSGVATKSTTATSHVKTTTGRRPNTEEIHNGPIIKLFLEKEINIPDKMSASSESKLVHRCKTLATLSALKPYLARVLQLKNAYVPVMLISSSMERPKRQTLDEIENAIKSFFKASPLDVDLDSGYKARIVGENGKFQNTDEPTDSLTKIIVIIVCGCVIGILLIALLIVLIIWLRHRKVCESKILVKNGKSTSITMTEPSAKPDLVILSDSEIMDSATVQNDVQTEPTMDDSEEKVCVENVETETFADEIKFTDKTEDDNKTTLGSVMTQTRVSTAASSMMGQEMIKRNRLKMKSAVKVATKELIKNEIDFSVETNMENSSIDLTAEDRENDVENDV